MRGTIIVCAALVACSSGGSDSSSPSSSSTSSSSSSSSSGNGGPRTCSEVASPAAAFGAYCTVQSTVELTVLRPSPPMGWLGKDEQCLAAGATIYLAADGRGDVEGYAFVDDGTTPAALWVAPVTTEMVEGQHYSGSCPKVLGVDPAKVVMRDANVYADQAFTGTPCKLAAATELPGLSFSNEDVGVVSVSGAAIQTACGFDKGYTKDLNVAALVKK